MLIQHLSRSCELDRSEAAAPTTSRGEACAAAIYLRSFLADWGPDGEQFIRDMKEIENIILHESKTTMLESLSTVQQSVVHPHMTLSYNIAPELKLLVAQSHSRAEKVYSLAMGGKITDSNSQLKRFRKEAKGTVYAITDDGNLKLESFRCNFFHNFRRNLYCLEAKKLSKRNADYRIKVGYICASIRSKAIMYLVQDFLRFHNRDAFEVHVFATSKPDNSEFIRFAMRGTFRFFYFNE